MFRRSFCIFFSVSLAACLSVTSQTASAAQCGYANGNEYSSSPQSVASLCAAGSPSAVSGSGPWSWTCTDSSTVSCNASRCGGPPPTSAYCCQVRCDVPAGSAVPLTGEYLDVQATSYFDASQNHCQPFLASSICEEPGAVARLSTLTGTCSGAPPSPVAGACNTATVNGCSQGSAINISSDASNDYWNCSGTNGGANSPQCVKAKTLACIPTGQPVPAGQTQCPTNSCFVAVSGSGFSNPTGTYVGASEIGNGSYIMTGLGMSNPTTPGDEFGGDFQNIVGPGNYPLTAPADLTFNFASPNPAAAGPVGLANYPVWDNTFLTQYPFAKAAHFTFDGIAIGTGTHITIYSGPNYTGSVLLDVTGPYIINELWYQDATNNTWLTEDWSSAPSMYQQFTPGTRHWSSAIGALHVWSRGTSMRVTCN